MLFPEGGREWTLPLRAIMHALRAIASASGQPSELGELLFATELLGHVDRESEDLLRKHA